MVSGSLRPSRPWSQVGSTQLLCAKVAATHADFESLAAGLSTVFSGSSSLMGKGRKKKNYPQCCLGMKNVRTLLFRLAIFAS
eukprot:501686-Amphidinium_carterae.1